MITICLAQFTEGPWVKVTTNVFNKALSFYKNDFKTEIIFGYPQKNYDIIILMGIRPIVKQKLDKHKILPFCKKLIDMGDSSMDPRTNYEDLYFYFLKSNKKLHKHYTFLPKPIITEHLFPDKYNDDLLTIYVDHFKYQNEMERETTINAINKIFSSIKSSKVPLRVFYHTSKGIELNKLSPEITKDKAQIARYLPYEEITKFYRKTDVFFPTHRETQGMVAQEIALCGGITVLQPWMYPKVTHNEFAHILYDQQDEIDFISIRNQVKNISPKVIRDHALKNCNLDKFKNALYDAIMDLIKT